MMTISTLYLYPFTKRTAELINIHYYFAIKCNRYRLEREIFKTNKHLTYAFTAIHSVIIFLQNALAWSWKLVEL